MRSTLSALAAALVAVLALAGCSSSPSVDQPPAAAAAPAENTAETPAPVTVDVPAIGAHSTLIPLGLAENGQVEVPSLDTPMQAGWYSLGVKPGDPGPAVVLAHVNANGHPGLFALLSTLKPGDVVSIGRADGSSVHFQITHVDTIPKGMFPTARVYGDTPDPEIRLITCGGDLDTVNHSYRSNVIAFGVEAP